MACKEGQFDVVYLMITKQCNVFVSIWMQHMWMKWLILNRPYKVEKLVSPFKIAKVDNWCCWTGDYKPIWMQNMRMEWLILN